MRISAIFRWKLFLGKMSSFSIEIISFITWWSKSMILLTVADMAQYQIFVQYQYQYFQEFCFQNQYQYQNSSNNFFNIKININIKIFPPSISKSISKIFKTQNQYQNRYQYRQNIVIAIENQNFLWLKNLFFHILWLMPLGNMGYHLIPIAPKHGTLGPS